MKGVFICKIHKERLRSEIQQIYDLISLLEKRSNYTVQELVEYYVSHSFNGYFFPFIKHLISKRRNVIK
jgi:hypothetical protein